MLETNAGDWLPPPTRGILRSYHGMPAASAQPEAARLAAILEMANALDEHFESQPFDTGEAEPLAEAALGCLQITPRSELWNVIHRLPVFPAAGQQALRVLLQEDWNCADLESIAASDPMLAAHVIRAANTALYGMSRNISSLPRAILHIGAKAAARILCAASMKPFYASRGLRQIWNHSLDAAQMAVQLAGLAGEKDSRQAFLAGLMHDVGRLALAMFPLEFQQRQERLLEKGCELVPVEQALCGFSHAEAGAAALKAWGFPAHIIEAVEFHHRPERTESRLAALLYLTEHWLDADEDLPSAVRLRASLERCNLKPGLRADLGPTADRALTGLKFAA